MMKRQIASFDIGIKNLAICVLDENKVINILGGEIHICSVCSKIATFSIEKEEL